MARGARSIRGSLSAYTWSSMAVTAGLALVLWLGPCTEPPPITVELAAGGAWVEGTLDDGVYVWELVPGEPVEVTPGSYRVTLFDADGLARRQSLVLTSLPVVVGAEPFSADRDAAR